MAVVINEMEVAPQPAPSEQQAQGGTDAGPKDNVKQLEKTLHKKLATANQIIASQINLKRSKYCNMLLLLIHQMIRHSTTWEIYGLDCVNMLKL